MSDSEDRVMEAQLRKVARQALRKIEKSIKNQPHSMIIESDDTEDGVTEQASADIRDFLFKRG
ncbi:MAG: hypothetical protein HYX82_00115 [Chloroflexi bacterium]|nr:hypothetical protein [Chloroflexota bacterium]